MTLLDSESSAHGGRPIELFEFEADGLAYYLTRHPTVYSFGGHDYRPSPGLVRDNKVTAAAGDKPPELIINVAESEDMVQANCYDSVPVEFTVRIHRIQPGGSHTWWDGVIAGASIKGDRAELRCPSVFDDEMQLELPTVHFTAQCQHFLRDQHCRIDPMDFTDPAVVDDLDGVVLTVDTISGHPDGYFRGGSVLSIGGERRTIVRHVGTTLTLFSPFRSVAITEAVTLFAGCDRRIVTCHTTFNNKRRFGGYPLIPLRNVFRSGFRGD